MVTHRNKTPADIYPIIHCFGLFHYRYRFSTKGIINKIKNPQGQTVH